MTLMTVEVILNKMKYLRIHNDSIHIISYQKRFISVRKNFLKFWKDRRTDVNM